jgi:hypothetical protein
MGEAGAAGRQACSFGQNSSYALLRWVRAKRGQTQARTSLARQARSFVLASLGPVRTYIDEDNSVS